MKELEVRCCCDAGKLLGYLPVRDELLEAGLRFTARLPPTRAPVLSGCAVRAAIQEESMVTSGDAIALSIGQVFANNREYKLAVKSNDYPIETLRRIPGFREPTEAEMQAHYDSLGIPPGAMVRRV